MLGILVIVNVNAINYAMLASISIMKTVSVEVALFEHVNECVCSYTVFIVLGVIVLTLGLALILPINTSSVIKKMFLYMIIFIKQKVIDHIKLE